MQNLLNFRFFIDNKCQGDCPPNPKHTRKPYDYPPNQIVRPRANPLPVRSQNRRKRHHLAKRQRIPHLAQHSRAWHPKPLPRAAT
ncbi:hypothetical protein [Moraxella lacunata]|uniref:hypothetical protein n=1 Tax=Moraxella lacunata TaxID=477 RepID=UPI003EE1704C